MPNAVRGLRTMVFSGALCSIAFAWLGSARAQDANVITVRPSGIEGRPIALSAEERLERRLKRSSDLLRSICVGCGSRDALAGAAPFHPLNALRAGAASQVLVQRVMPDEVIVELAPAPAPIDPPTGSSGPR